MNPNSALERFGAKSLNVCEGAGQVLVLFVQILRETRKSLHQRERIFVQMKIVGNDTLFIAVTLALFIGMVLALHSGSTLRRFDFQQAMASIVALSMVKEMAPVITALLLAARVGAAITAEIGTMQVNEEIDALHTLGVSPVRYLAVPRFLACMAMLPVLVCYAGMVGILGGAIVAVAYFQIGFQSYMKSSFDAMTFGDVREGLIKAAFFGAIVALIACHRGFRTRGGAEGVGRAITGCEVTSFVSIICCDYFITRFLL